MSDVEKLQELLDKIPYPVLFEIVDAVWYKDGSVLYWNGQSNTQDLYYQEGDTYSGWMREGGVEWDGYFVTNLDTSTGTMVTYLFPLDKEVKLEDLEEMYE